MLRSDRRHAQVLIFINNALLKRLDAQVFTQGLAVGRRRQPGAQGRNQAAVGQQNQRISGFEIPVHQIDKREQPVCVISMRMGTDGKPDVFQRDPALSQILYHLRSHIDKIIKPVDLQHNGRTAAIGFRHAV